MTRAEITAKVQLCLDEINGLSEGQTIMDAQIEGQLDDSAVSLLLLLPSFLSDPVAPEAALPITGGVITMPDDFLKVGTLKLTSWGVHIEKPLPISHPRVSYESYGYLKATPNNPLAAIKNEAGSIKILLAPVAESDSVELFYVARPEAAEDLADKLIDMLAWHTSERIFTAYGETEKSMAAKARLEEIVKNSILV